MSIQGADQRYRARRIMIDTRFDLRTRHVNLWNHIFTTEVQSGTQFLIAQPGGQLYIVLGTTHEVISLPRSGRGGDRWHAYFHTIYGFGEHEVPAKFAYDSLRSYVICNGAKVEVRRFAAYNQATHTAYLSAYNGQLWKIEGSEQIEMRPNGEDDVFFIDDDDGEPVTPDIAPHGLLLNQLTTINYTAQGLSGITPEQQRMALTVWIFMLAFPDLMPTKPLLLIEGTQGSGKSASCELIQLALMGMSRAMVLQRNKEDDFGVVLLRSPIALFDNTDSYIEWVPDAVCAYATGAKWTKRRLYSDDESLTIKPQAFIVVATKNPASFRREDTADRCIILRLERRENFRPLRALKQEILDTRAQLFGEYLWYVGRIVYEMRAGAFDLDINETHRMADFAAFSRVVGRVLGWTEESISDLMTALQGERDAFINEDDPLIDLLQRWIVYKRQNNGPSNIGRTITTFELHAELESLAQASGIPWKQSARTLGQKLRSPHIEREFVVEIGAAGGHKTYKLWRNTDPRFKMVD